jgi:hypothetical protein
MLGVLGLCVLGFIVISVQGLSMLKKQSDEMVNLKLKNRTADAQLSNLEVAKKEIDKYSYFKKVASSVIPNDKDQAQAVLDILDIANQSGITIQSVTFPSSDLASKTTTKAISQSKPVAGIPGLYSVELTITPATGAAVAVDKQVTYAKVLDFLNRIENNRRTAQISQVNIQPISSPDGNNQINFGLTINIFIKP